MRIGMMCTWDQACGIATYSEALAASLVGPGSEDEVVVLGCRPELGESLRGDAPDVGPVVRCWERLTTDSDYHEVLLEAERLGVDVLHVQHEHGLFRTSAPVSPHLLNLLEQARARGMRTVVTLHTVESESGLSGGPYQWLRDTADAIVVHTLQARAAVESAPGSARVVHIAHGTPWADGAREDRERGRALLGLPPALADHLVCMVFGFVGSGKNLLQTIASFDEAADHCPPMVLVVRGRVHPDYRAVLHAVARQVAYPVVVQATWTAAADVPHLLTAADFGVLNTLSWNLSASGQVHTQAPFLPLAVADRPIYSDAVAAGAVPFQVRDDEAVPEPTLVAAIAALARSAEFRADVGFRLRGLALATPWWHQASHHRALYERLVDSREQSQVGGEVA